MTTGPEVPTRRPKIDFLIRATRISSALLFVLAAFVWGLLPGLVHNFSTLHPDAMHTFAVHEHGGTFYLKPTLGWLYINLLWIWVSLLAVTVLLTWLGREESRRSM